MKKSKNKKVQSSSDIDRPVFIEGETGFKCSKCKTKHFFDVYVFAHWSETTIHRCQCGSKHYIIQGVSEYINSSVY